MKNRVPYFLLLLMLIYACQPSSQKQFELTDENETGINFNNALSYTEEFNPYTYRNFYNGAGVALGDINNDGLLDIYFTGNIVDNKLFLNKGDWQFEDITATAGVACKGVWSSGATFVDINADGYLDLYVCKSGKPGGERRHNELFINQGDNTFVEQSKEYGLAIEGLSVHAAFLDYDRDGDLDCYILNNSIRSVGGYDLIEGQRNIPDPNNNGNKFFENQNGHFVDVTTNVGMYTSAIGFGLGITVSDFNKDDWPDLFISNDFFEKDYLYINQKGKGFKEVSDSYFGSLSMGSMGADAADLDNDLQPDLLVTEMLPTSIERKKTKAKYDSWDKYSLMQRRGYANQVPRNVLQRNIEGEGFFEIGRKSGVAATEWSWASLLFDMDNDGLRDIFIANGINKDLLDRDYLAYMANEQQVRMLMRQKEEVIKKLIDIMPSKAVSNVAYKNEGKFNFTNTTKAWGLDQPSFSNGNAYGDLDNDGDLDLVVNNVNMPSFVYKNQTDTLSHRSLQLKLIAEGDNTKGVGAKVTLFLGDQKMIGELYPSRGFQSSVPHRLHFGLGSNQKVDSLQVIWPNGKENWYRDLPSNTLYTLSQTSTGTLPLQKDNKVRHEQPSPLFQFTHQENNFIEFNRERLVTQMHHNEGPALAAADINWDGMDDVFLGGGKGQIAQLFMSNPEGEYQAVSTPFEKDRGAEDTNALWVDIDQDNDLDLIVTSGGKAFSIYSPDLDDRIYENQGDGTLKKKISPWTKDRPFSAKALAAADVNRDGKIDLFIGERFDLSTYGIPSDGFLMLNEGEGTFKQSIQAALEKVGMITDAAFTDINKDGWPDLVLVGEWMPITILMNQEGTFVNATTDYQLGQTVGLWNVLLVKDINQDGQEDLIVGNHGTNTFLEPKMRLFINDFDRNGSAEQILCVLRDKKYYPVADKDELIAQLPSLKKKIVYYADYAQKDITQILDPLKVKEAYSATLDMLETNVFIGGNKGFTPIKFPEEIQYAPVYAISSSTDKINGEKSLYLGGNQYLVKPQFGRYDASKGWKIPFFGQGDSVSFGRPKAMGIDGQIRGILSINLNNTSCYIFAINDDEVRFYQSP
ncbi:MAG: VCBS repeat-containing protein [Flavobacteriaceae bacterium]